MKSHSLDHFKALVSSSSDAIISKTLDGTVTSWNAAAERIFGYTEAEMLGQKMLVLFPQALLHEEDRILDAIRSGNTIEHFRTARIHKCGRTIDVSVTISPIYDHKHRIMGASIIARDVTEHMSLHRKAIHFESIVQNSDDAIVGKTLDGIVESWNKSAEKIFGYTAIEMIGESILKLFPEDRLAEEKVIINKVAQGETVDHFRTQRLHKNGDLIDLSVTVSPIKNLEGRVIGASKIARDVTRQVLSEHQLLQFQALIESSEDAIISKSLDGRITTWNKAAERLFGYTEAEAVGQNIVMLFPEERLAEEDKLMKSLLAGKSIRHFRTTRLTKSGNRVFVSVTLSPIRDKAKNITGVSKIVRDVSYEIEQEKVVWRLANYDSLTNLFNRTGMTACIEELVQLSIVRQRKFALLYLDLDGFKAYNDKFGHDFGDRLLIAVAEKLRKAVRSSDEVGRLGGDEFVVCMMGFETIKHIQVTIENIIGAIHSIDVIDDVDISLTASIGIAIFPEDGRSCQTLISRADHAMYSAKSKGKDTFEFYSGVIETSIQQDNSMVKELRDAIAHNALELRFQPQVNATTQEVKKVEVLVRWNHPQLGFVPPDTFIPLAEKYGLIRDLDAWVMDTALEKLVKWTGLFGMDFQVSLNKSAYELVDAELSISQIRNKLHAVGLCGENIIIELTERALMVDPQSAEKALRQFTAMGIELAIDDFGTGYSSLAYLKYFPVKYLKLDKTFVHAFQHNETDRVLVEGVLNIAKQLGIAVVAEGVETAEQVALLNELNCEYYQGYYFAKPLTADELESFVLSKKRQTSLT
ncbi:PAS domain S-box protein [Alteromonas sp. AMM-1]|uniref:sensor domain-containing protein n=1 Tax=Alteromonas sp. AMM-1 TaxID=3394233 RepID=UPI0039A64F3D